MNWTTEQLAAHSRRLIEGDGGRAVTAPPPLLRRERCYRSKTEAAFAQWLDLQVLAGVVREWRYEETRIRLAAGKTYVPDFLIVGTDGSLHFAEIKGRKGQSFYSRDVSKLKFAVAARLNPWWRFVVYFPAARLGEWESHEVPSK